MKITFKVGIDDLVWEDVLGIFTNKEKDINPEKSQLACDNIKTAFTNSYVVLSAWIGDEMVGFCRALSDGIRQSVIYDLNVMKSFRNKGIGKQLMIKVVSLLPNGPIILYAIPGKEGFYQDIGFKKLQTGMAMFPDMEKRVSQGFIGNEI